jgi:Rrf2 family protein
MSEAASIAFHTVLVLAGGRENLLRRQDLAKRMNVSADHLAKVIQRLSRAGVLETSRGPHGGCRLTETALRMSLLEIYEAVEGAYQPLDCLLQKKICAGECCLLGGVLQSMSRKIYQQLKTTTVRDVACELVNDPDLNGN